MAPQIGNSSGIALVLAACLLASLFATGISFAPTAEGHVPDTDNTPGCDVPHEDFHDVSCEDPGHDIPHRNVNDDVDGGRDRQLVLKVYPPEGNRAGYLGSGDQIKITLTRFDLSKSTFSNPETLGRIDISDSANATVSNPTAVGISSGDTLTLTLPNISTSHADGAGEYLIITIEEGTGILTPDVPKGFDDGTEGYPVAITFVDVATGSESDASDVNIVVVKNPLSTFTPSATVQVELATYAEVDIRGAEEITVDFSGPSAGSGFTVADDIRVSEVRIRSAGRTFNPSEVAVQGSRVILSIPTETGPNPPVVAKGEYTIIFDKAANIKNPFTSGNKVITVSSDVPGAEEDEITAVIKQTLTVDPEAGARGSQITLTGRGYDEGTVTIFDGYDDNVDEGEILASTRTSKGVFKVNLITRGQKGDLIYVIRTIDSYGVLDSIDFLITSSMSFEPAGVGVGSKLEITVKDWEDHDKAVAAVRIAGRPAYITGLRERTACFEYTGAYRADKYGEVSLEVIVPHGVLLGGQRVSVYAHDQLEYVYEDGLVITDKGPCLDLPEGASKGGVVSRSKVRARLKNDPNPTAAEIVEIVSLPLGLTPATAARGEEIIITGSGFTRGRRGEFDIHRVSIGAVAVIENPATFEVQSNGNITLTVTVPLEIPVGRNEVRVEGTDNIKGQATLVISEETIAVVPEEGPRGAKAAVTGKGFLANELVLLSYGEDEGLSSDQAHIGITRADSKGNFSMGFTVPIAAEIGGTYKVKAVVLTDTDSRGETIEVGAEAEHSVPSPLLTANPGSVIPGDAVTIRGESLPAYSPVDSVTIDGKSLAIYQDLSTDEDGIFELTGIMPYALPGMRTIRVEVAGLVAAHVIEVVSPPLSGPPAEVFKELIYADSLVRVWHLNNSDQTWSFFDPNPEFAPFNTLTEVNSGQILRVVMREHHVFQGDDLYAGQNPIQLK